MLIDIEKIEQITKNRTINDMQLRLFNEKFNIVKEKDLTEIRTMFKEIDTLLWKTNLWDSSFITENHKKLTMIINKLYTQISILLRYDFHAKYLTEKFSVCVSFYSFIQKKAVL